MATSASRRFARSIVVSVFALATTVASIPAHAAATSTTTTTTTTKAPGKWDQYHGKKGAFAGAVLGAVLWPLAPVIWPATALAFVLYNGGQVRSDFNAGTHRFSRGMRNAGGRVKDSWRALFGRERIGEREKALENEVREYEALKAAAAAQYPQMTERGMVIGPYTTWTPPTTTIPSTTTVSSTTTPTTPGTTTLPETTQTNVRTEIPSKSTLPAAASTTTTTTTPNQQPPTTPIAIDEVPGAVQRDKDGKLIWIPAR